MDAGGAENRRLGQYEQARRLIMIFAINADDGCDQAGAGLNIEQIVPVNLKAGYEYNVNDGFVPAIYQQLNQANQ
jgi:hypothetical protein